tara:strand:+ start:819 stop:1040 length:222 start_codon:yes stop_codon:yes gene_type:complete
MKKILLIAAVAFMFSSCQKCMECTNNKAFTSQEGEFEYEVEICEDDFDSKEEMEDYVRSFEEEEGARCYRNLW